MAVIVSELAVFQTCSWLENHNFGNWNRIV